MITLSIVRLFASSCALLLLTRTLFPYQTQIDAHLALHGSQIAKEFNISPHSDPIIQKMKLQAQKYANTHYELYHAQDAQYFIVQDIYKRFKEFFELTLFEPTFTFLRFNDPIFSEYTCIKDFIAQKILEKNNICDSNADIYTFLLSTNLSPFGNYNQHGESTYYYYKKNHSCRNLASSLLEKICNSFDLPNYYVSHLRNLIYSKHFSHGTLFQILIPKEIIDDVGYKCFSYGKPFYNSWSSIDKKDPLCAEYNLSPASCQDLINGLFENQFTLSSLLEVYRSNPSLLHNMNNIQARLLLSNNYLLNPNSGIIINRFIPLNDKELSEYSKNLDTTIDNILIDLFNDALEKGFLLPEATQKRIEKLIKKTESSSPFTLFVGKNKPPKKAGEVIKKIRNLQQAKKK